MFSSLNLSQRFIAAIGFMTMLTLIVCFVSTFSWHQLEERIELVIDTNLATLQKSYTLERQTFYLQSALYRFVQGPDFLARKQAKEDVEAKLKQLKHTLKSMEKSPYYHALLQSYLTLDSQIKRYNGVINQRYNLYQSGKEKHRELIINYSEINQLIAKLQEKLTSKKDKNIDQYKQKTKIFTALSNLENQLYQTLQSLFIPYTPSNYQHIFEQVNYLQESINYRLKELQIAPLSNEMMALNTLIKQQNQWMQPNGKLYQHQVERNAFNKTLTSQLNTLHNTLNAQEKIINQWVGEASQNLKSINKKTKSAIRLTYGFLISLVIITLASAILLMIYLIRKGLIARLNRLSEHLLAISQGQFNQKINLGGLDEIGKIGKSLELFCQQQQELQKLNALNLINNTEVSLITCNLDGLIDSVNTQARTLFNLEYNPHTLFLWQLFEGNEHQIIHTLFKTNEHIQPPQHQRLNVIKKYNHQTHYLRLDLRLFIQGKTQKLIVTITDITEQVNTARWLEEQVTQKTKSLQKANQQLRQEIQDRKQIEDSLIQAAKMAVVGQTMTSLAHELNQPLSAMSTYLFTLDLALQQKKYSTIEKNTLKMKELTERMNQIINTLKGFSKRQSSEIPRQQIQVSRGIDEATLLIKNRLVNSNIALKSGIPENCFAFANTVNLEQVWVNLLLNSCDAIAHQTNKTITISIFSEQKNRLVIGLEDSGTGFNTAIIAQLFTPFITTKEVGLGLGLNICRSLLHRMQGEIYLASTLQGGGLVIIELQREPT
jgi:two-component system phosphoglycerate transport system sensor histidine kinase PgtB